MGEMPCLVLGCRCFVSRSCEFDRVECVTRSKVQEAVAVAWYHPDASEQHSSLESLRTSAIVRLLGSACRVIQLLTTSMRLRQVATIPRSMLLFYHNSHTKWHHVSSRLEATDVGGRRKQANSESSRLVHR